MDWFIADIHPEIWLPGPCQKHQQLRWLPLLRVGWLDSWDAWDIGKLEARDSSTIWSRDSYIILIQFIHGYFFFTFIILKVLPRWCNGKECTCQCRRRRTHRFDPRVGKIPWRRKWQLTPVCLPEKLHGQRSLGAIVRGVTESDWVAEHAHNINNPLIPLNLNLEIL